MRASGEKTEQNVIGRGKEQAQMALNAYYDALRWIDQTAFSLDVQMHREKDQDLCCFKLSP